MQHPDFRVKGKVFATLAPGGEWGVLKLTLQRQTGLIREQPELFEPCAGAWGARGYTKVRLASARPALIAPLMRESWRLVAPAKLRAQHPDV